MPFDDLPDAKSETHCCLKKSRLRLVTEHVGIDINSSSELLVRRQMFVAGRYRNCCLPVPLSGKGTSVLYSMIYSST